MRTSSRTNLKPWNSISANLHHGENPQQWELPPVGTCQWELPFRQHFHQHGNLHQCEPLLMGNPINGGTSISWGAQIGGNLHQWRNFRE